MAEVTIRAEQAVGELRPGMVVTVERTPRIDRLIEHGRVTVVDEVSVPEDPDHLPHDPDQDDLGDEQARSTPPQIVTGPADAVDAIQHVELPPSTPRGKGKSSDAG